MTKYKIELMRVDTSYLTVEVEASSAVEADGLVDDLLCEEDYPPGEDEADVKLGSWEVHTDAMETRTDGRAEVLRAACEAAGIPVEDRRLPPADTSVLSGLPRVDED